MDAGTNENLRQGSIESVQLEQRFLRQDQEVVWVVLSVTKIAEAPGESAKLFCKCRILPIANGSKNV